jgi:hypothetical protein
MTAGCRKDDINKQNAATLEGKWHLVLMTGGFGGIHMTAVEWGHTQSYEFKSQGNCTYMLDGNATDMKYALSTGTSYTRNGDATFVTLSNGLLLEYRFERDTLVLAGNVAADAMSEWYVR